MRIDRKKKDDARAHRMRPTKIPNQGPVVMRLRDWACLARALTAYVIRYEIDAAVGVLIIDMLRDSGLHGLDGFHLLLLWNALSEERNKTDAVRGLYFKAGHYAVDYLNREEKAS
jgi:hypothetical protein